MLRIVLVTIFSAAFILSTIAQSKKTKNTKQPDISTNVIDSAKWREEYHIVNRDSAFANPYLGIQKLIGGNKRFVEGKSIRPRQDISTLRNLKTGQEPYAIIISCADSRVPNEMVMDQGFGDLFIIRTAGQVSAEASFGSIEYAVINLHTKLIVVLGHTACGAVAAAVEKPENPPGHIVNLINAIKPAVTKSAKLPGDPLDNAVKQNVIEQVYRLRDLEPTLSRKYAKGEILIVGAVFDFNTGKIEFLPETMANLPAFVPSAAPKEKH